jgi:hypothetical protein
MQCRWLRSVVPIVMLVGLVGPVPAIEPITYILKFPAPGQHRAEVESVYPTGGRAAIELMMPIWAPRVLSRRKLCRQSPGCVRDGFVSEPEA